MNQLKPHLFVSALLCCISLSAASVSYPWKAGVASVDITPSESIWLAGYAARDHPSTGVLNPIRAKALFLQPENGRQLLIINAELLFFPRGVSDEIMAQLRNKHGLSRHQVLFAATHSHSSPVIEDRTIGMYQLDAENRKKIAAYTRSIENRIVEAAEAAMKAPAAARLSYGHGTAGFAINRRGVNKDDPVDHDVPVLLIEWAPGKEGKKKRAVVFSYACHNTTLSGYEVCGDYSGFAQTALEQNNPAMTALFITGCAGDSNPSPRRKVEYARAHGKELAGSVEHVMKQPMQPVESCSQALFDWALLPLTPVPSRAEIKERCSHTNVYERICAQQLMEQLDSGRGIAPAYPLPLQIFRLGKGRNAFTLLALGGEVVVDYALRIKRKYGKEGILVAGYANDAPSYIPSERVLKEGGYEGGGAMRYFGVHGPWAPGVETRVMECVHKLFAALKTTAK